MGSAGHFNYCLACFCTLTEHKQSSKLVSHFIADLNVTYRELEQNPPTVTYYVIYHVQSTWMSCMRNIVQIVQYNCFLQMLH